jgi:hypothetical protein
MEILSKRGTSSVDRMVSASELAQLGYCERAVYFDHKRGVRRTRDQVRAQARGTAAHDRFYRAGLDVMRTSQRKGRCFIATQVFGDGPETRALRTFRDLYLRRNQLGRWLIGFYYRTSPTVCEFLERRPVQTGWMRAALRPLVAMARRATALRLGR